MKNVLFILLLLVTLQDTLFAQITPNQLPFRVVTVSPNYPNLYPRFNTLQATYLSIKDSTITDPAKYFIVNIVTSYHNITDWTSGWKDSILAKDPYIKITSFGQAINDSIIGVTTEEFTLVAGIIGLNSATAGNGLNFSSHKYNILLSQIGVLQINSDSLILNYNANHFQSNAGVLNWYKSTNSGIQSTSTGFKLLPRNPIFITGDTTAIRLSYYFLPVDSLTLDWNTNHFNLMYEVSPAIHIKLDSGLTSNSNGIRINKFHPHFEYTTGQLRLNSNLLSDGLEWSSNEIRLKTSYEFLLNDSLYLDLDYNNQFNHNYEESPHITLKLDSGLTSNSNGIYVKVDNERVDLNTSKEITLPENIAGDGIVWESNTLDIQPNDFADLDNDTLKIKTATSFLLSGDSLYAALDFIEPADSMGIPCLKTTIKRVIVCYTTVSNNDSCLVYYQNSSIVNGTLVVRWDNGNSQMEFYRRTTPSTYISLFDCKMPNFETNRRWTVLVETYMDAQ